VIASNPNPFRLLAVFCLALAITLLMACGGGDDDEETPTPEPTEKETAEATSGAQEDSVSVGLSFWHAGWKVTLADATLTTGDSGSGEVAIEAEFENLGTDQATFDSQLLLTSGGNDYTDETFDGHDLPAVPGERTGSGSFNFRVDEEFSLDDATLMVGNSQNNQAIIPIGPDGDDYVSLEPRLIEASGSVTAGAVTLTVEGAEIRADLPDRHSEMEEGKLALTVYFSATPSAGIQVGQGVLQSPNVALKLPDGTTVAVIDDGVSGVNELLQGREGTTISDLKVRFPVDVPAEGTYALILRGKYGPGGADIEGELPFVVEGPASPSP
jgi:hypothetical protein